MKSRIVTLLVFCLLLAFTGMAQANAYTDTVEFSTPYFAPNESATYSSPYYRWHNEDWGWQHSVLSSSVTSINTASLYISAFDVDAPSEVDNIYIYNNTNSTWDLLGSLAGNNNVYGYTTFSLGSQYFDEILAGLNVWIDIDSTHEYDYWAVTLGKSVLSIDGSPIPNPNPGSVPLPGAVLLFAPGLAGLVAIRRRMNS